MTQDQSDHDQGGQLKGDQGNQVDQREPDQDAGCSATELPTATVAAKPLVKVGHLSAAL